MNERLLELAARHGGLRARIEEQRRQLARHTRPLQSTLAKGDVLLDGVDWLKAHPGAVGAVAAAAVVAKPARLWRWGSRAFSLWRGWQILQKKIRG